MKYLITVLFILLLTASVAIAGNQWKSEYDISWDVTVTDCRGNTTVYEDSLIVNDGDSFVTFMPNQGKIASGNGPIIKVYRSDCTSIVMSAD